MNETTRQLIVHKVKHNTKRLITSIKWVIFSIVVGIVAGSCGTAFYFALSVVTDFRMKYPWLIYFLPIGGLAIVGLYHLCKDDNDTGTNLVISAIHSGDKVPFIMAPLIFVSTLITHLFGGSAGREGAALQMGGSIGSSIGRVFRFDEKDKHVMIMCGMSAAFSALFGTPMAAAIFSMEMISVGVMYYIALVPCVISSLIAHGIASYFNVTNEFFAIENIPDFTILNSVKISVLAILCALVSILFCVALHSGEALYKKYLPNKYTRVFIGGCFVIIATMLVGNQTYNGTGMSVIQSSIDGSVRPEAFLLKIIFTALTLGAGFKGGEIVPSFFIGATFGCLFGNLTGFEPSLCTAVGMISLFCGVTNCPITSLLISFELFGYDGMKHKNIIGPTKRKKVRIVDFGDTLTEILKAARKEQLKNRMQYGELYHRNYYKEVHVKNRVYYEYYHLDGTQEVPTDYKEISFVCLRPDGSLELPSTLSIVCRSVAKKLEGFEDFHFHQLRHTYTSNLLSNGAAPKDVQELLGHSDVSTTMNIYAHSTRKAKRDSARLLDKVASNA